MSYQIFFVQKKPLRQVIISSIAFGILLYFSILYTAGKEGMQCDNEIWDVYSFSHFLSHMVIVFAFLFFMKKRSAIIGSIAISFLWEITEYLATPLWYNLFCESIGNHLLDIVFGTAGTCLCLVFLRNYE